jgi:hypothetical protein
MAGPMVTAIAKYCFASRILQPEVPSLLLPDFFGTNHQRKNHHRESSCQIIAVKKTSLNQSGSSLQLATAPNQG